MTLDERLIPLISETLAAVSVLLVWDIADWGLRLVGVQTVLALMVETAGNIMDNNRYPNAWLFNIYLVADFTLLLTAGYYSLHDKARKIYWAAALGVLCISLQIEMAMRGIHTFAKTTFVLESLCVTIAFLLVLYDIALTHNGPLTKHPLFWISLGLVIFYGSSIPYFSLLGIIDKVCSISQQKILYRILICLSSVRYCFTAVGFYLNKEQSQLNDGL